MKQILILIPDEVFAVLRRHVELREAFGAPYGPADDFVVGVIGAIDSGHKEKAFQLTMAATSEQEH